MTSKKSAPMSIKEGCFYTFQNRNKRTLVRVLEKNKVDNLHLVLHDGVEKRMDLNRVGRLRRVSRKSDPSNMFLYLCDIGSGCYKVGITSCPQRRRKEIRTYTRKANFICLYKLKDVSNAREYEKMILELFSKQISEEGGREVLELNPSMLNTCRRHMKSILSSNNSVQTHCRKKNERHVSVLEEKGCCSS